MPDERGWRTDPSFDEPVDLAALRCDDALLDAIANATFDLNPEQAMGLDSFGWDTFGWDSSELDSLGLDAGADRAQQRLASVLLGWRRDVDAEPFPELIDVESAIAAIGSARRGSRPRRSAAPFAAAAAFFVIVLSGVALAAHTATPGDPLWSVSKVLYAQRADSMEAAAMVSGKLDDAKKALLAGKPQAAASALQDAKAQLPAVRPQENHAGLAAEGNTLGSQVDQAPATDPPGSTPATTSQSPLATSPLATSTPATTTSTAPTTTPSTHPTKPPPSTHPSPRRPPGHPGHPGHPPSRCPRRVPERTPPPCS